ncbi:MAG: cobalamin biosynthesis protein, partial [Candidatus Omnitrophica bacterium]|nr:cobalamin biosynthesis protein [Candidatus Omnitrophota bacterium]
DGRKHLSPNSGMPEAAMAGALGIRLGGVSAYQGKTTEASYLGEEKRNIQPFFINEALAISLIVSVLMLFTGVALKWLI